MIFQNKVIEQFANSNDTRLSTDREITDPLKIKALMFDDDSSNISNHILNQKNIILFTASNTLLMKMSIKQLKLLESL